MAVTFKAVVIPGNRRNDGTYNVKIRVTFAGKARRLPTNIYAGPGDLTRSLRIKSPDILNRTDALIARMRDAVADISPFDLEGRDVDYVVRRIKEEMQGGSFRLDFFAFADEFLAGKTPQTRRSYVSAVNALERFVGRRQLDVNDITKAMLLDFVAFVDAEPRLWWDPKKNAARKTARAKKGSSSSARYIARLAAIYAGARERYNDEDGGRIVIPRTPFYYVKVQAPAPQGQRNLGEELMQRIILARGRTQKEEAALDAFRLSFLLMGANLADLYAARAFEGDVWTYNRKKTQARRADRAAMRVTIPPEARPILARLTQGRGGAWLARLHTYAKDTDDCTAFVNRNLRAWAEREGVAPFTFYAARHSWASIARKAGVEKATIDECLCHVGDFAITDIYAERSWDLLDAANRTVLELFSWE